jgi:hypothetical protein
VPDHPRCHLYVSSPHDFLIRDAAKQPTTTFPPSVAAFRLLPAAPRPAPSSRQHIQLHRLVLLTHHTRHRTRSPGPCQPRRFPTFLLPPADFLVDARHTRRRTPPSSHQPCRIATIRAWDQRQHRLADHGDGNVSRFDQLTGLVAS